MRSRRSFYTKAEEAVPWEEKAVRELSPGALGLLYFLTHGPSNGRTLDGLTVGVNRAYMDVMAAQLGWEPEFTSTTLRELEEKGWVIHDEDRGVSTLPRMVQPCDNANHFRGTITRLMRRLPRSNVSNAYIELMVRKTAESARGWGKDREAFEELLADLSRAFPEIGLIDDALDDSPRSP